MFTIKYSKPIFTIFKRYEKTLPSQERILQTLIRLEKAHPQNLYPGTKKALVIGDNGSTEFDLVTATYLLRRAGIVTTFAALNGYEPIRCSRGLHIKPDSDVKTIKDKEFELILIPSGYKSVRSMCSNKYIGSLLKKQQTRKGIVATSTLGAVVLAFHNIYTNHEITGHPATKPILTEFFKYKDQKTVVDDKLFSCRHLPDTIDMTFLLIEHVAGVDTALTLAQRLYYKDE